MTLCNQHETFRSINLVFCRFPDIIYFSSDPDGSRLRGSDVTVTRRAAPTAARAFVGITPLSQSRNTRVQSAQQFSEIKTITPDQYQCLCQVGLCLVILDKFITSYLFFQDLLFTFDEHEPFSCDKCLCV